MESNVNTGAEADPNKKDEITSYGCSAMDHSWLFRATEEKLLVTIKCGKPPVTFTVLKPILTKHSKFFDRCLRNPCKESESSMIELPEVMPGIMMLYLTLATRQAIMNGNPSEKILVEREDFENRKATGHHVRFYKLCDFLLNEELANGVRKMIVDCLKGLIKVDYDSKNAANIFRINADAFDVLEEGSFGQAKVRRILVKNFCRMVTNSAFFKHFSALKDHPQFLADVNRQYALNAIWKDPTQREIAAQIKTQRMHIDDESEPEQ